MEAVMKNRFIAIDFETANQSRDSACSVGIVLVENMKIKKKVSFLIQPPEPDFCFTHIHGITPEDVADAPLFPSVWEKILPFFSHIDFAAAHNAVFDSGVLAACCERYGIVLPDIEFRCTRNLARKYLQLESNALDSVSRHYRIKLNHHDALSDATACAKIMMRFMQLEKGG